jgi:heme oxygenase
MDRPDVSAALLRTTSDDFAQKLQARLIEVADATDDEAYASRLRLIASGKRPLRTLLADPQWREAFGSQMQLLAKPPALDEEQRRALDDAVEQARQHPARPSEDQVASDAADVMRRATLAQEAIREEELNGWTYVHDAGDGVEHRTEGDR